ncbi:MAG: hypothetical protein ACK4HQ_08580 [Brevinematales bacterium]
MKTITWKNHLPPFFYDRIGNQTTMDRKCLKETLLATDGWVMIQGCLCDIRSKHIGGGIYTVYSVLRR